MQYEEIEKLIEDHIDLIHVDANALANSKDRSARFLVIQAILATYLKSLEEAKAQLTTITEASFAQAIKYASGKNVTENKISASVDPQYSSTRENSEKLDAEINWIKTHMKIFENAHILFRQFLRES
jgi:hypothetical protein